MHLKASRVLRFFLSFVALIAVVTGTTLPAHAATGDLVSCVGTNKITYQPGLTNQSQTVSLSVKDTYSSCTSSDPTLTAGSDALSGNFTLSCQQLLDSPETITVQWNNHQSSTISLTVFPAVFVGGILVDPGVGSVVSGEFSGDTVTAQFDDALDPLQCELPGGVTSEVGTSTLQIVGP